MREKKNLYEKFGVAEYIVIDPLEEYVERFLLNEEGAYSRGEVFGPQEVLPMRSLEGIEIDLWEIFEVEKV
ncbi:MAG: Uma2 family endonuclease [Planctomycetota bacterium]